MAKCKPHRMSFITVNQTQMNTAGRPTKQQLMEAVMKNI